MYRTVDGGQGEDRVPGEDHQFLIPGRLIAFNLEFDCFRLPDHCTLEQTGVSVEELRVKFGISVHGIVPCDGDNALKPTWYLTDDTQVKAGYICLVIREPQADGGTRTSSQGEAVRLLMEMDQAAFEQRLRSNAAIEQEAPIEPQAEAPPRPCSIL